MSPLKHHPTIRYMVYNGYYKVMSNIPKMGQLPTPVKTRAFWPVFKIAFLFAAARAENRRLKSSFVDFWAAPSPRPLNIESAVFGVSLAYNFEIFGSSKRFCPCFWGCWPKNGWIEQNSLRRNAVTKNAFLKFCESFV